MAISISKARKILGKTSKKFSDEQIESLIIQFTGIAEIVTEIVGSKNTPKGIETTFRKVDD